MFSNSNCASVPLVANLDGNCNNNGWGADGGWWILIILFAIFGWGGNGFGWGGNNGTTVTAGILANKHKITWNTKKGVQHPNYYGSISQSSTVKVGTVPGGDLYVPFNRLLPLVNPNDLVIGGWDISSMNLGDAMKRAAVYDYDFQQVMYPYMKEFKPMPSIYYPDYIAANQSDRADNVIPGNDKQAHLEHIRADMRRFKEENK